MNETFHRRTVAGLLLLYMGLAIFSSVQMILLDTANRQKENPKPCGHVNNYLLFEASHDHLLEGEDIYRSYEAEGGPCHTFKYSPAFALFFGIFCYLPLALGLILWNCLNAGVLFWGLRRLPSLAAKGQIFLLLLLAVEMMTSLQNLQSNVLIAGLLLLSFSWLERGKYKYATAAIIGAGFIKFTALGALIIFLFYPQKGKLALYSLAWGLFFLLIPVVVTGPEHLLELYGSWYRRISVDSGLYHGMSLHGLMKSVFGFENARLSLILGGLVLFLLPFFRRAHYANLQFRALGLASAMMFMVIFNSKAESPTYIIAFSGIGLWFFYTSPSRINLFLLILAILFTSLATTDLSGHWFRNHIFYPYSIKVIPVFLVWLKAVWDMGRGSFSLR